MRLYDLCKAQQSVSSTSLTGLEYFSSLRFCFLRPCVGMIGYGFCYFGSDGSLRLVSKGIRARRSIDISEMADASQETGFQNATLVIDLPRMKGALIAGAAVRVLIRATLSQSAQSWIAGRIEISTPITSFKRRECSLLPLYFLHSV